MSPSSSVPASSVVPLSHEELLAQLTVTLQQDPTSAATHEFHAKALDILDKNKPSHDLFPKGIEVANLPQHVQESYKHVQALSPEKQSKISYYEKNGEWCINLDGTKISLQNESAENNSKNGINVVEGNTYFSQPAALAHAKSKWRSLPTTTLWKQMATFLGWFKELKNVLQIPLNGWFHPVVGRQGFGYYADVWSAVSREYMCVNADDGDVNHTGNPAVGHGVRFLDA